MGGGGGPPPPSPVIVGAFIMTFAAGLLDATTMLSWAGTTSTHMSGKFLKVGVSTAQGDIKGLTPSFCMVFSFFIGAFSAGVMTATPKRKTLYTCALGMFIVGIGCCLTSILFLAAVPDAVASGYPWYKTAVVAPYVAALTSGFQNAMLTTITGFMRSTHMTGTVTDVGLLCGQAYPDKMKDKAHWWKTRNRAEAQTQHAIVAPPRLLRVLWQCVACVACFLRCSLLHALTCALCEPSCAKAFSPA